MPPPPPVALSRIGSPTARAAASASSALASSGEPLSTGTCASSASSRAVCFWENMRMVAAVGPRKAMPFRSHFSLKSAFSERKP